MNKEELKERIEHADATHKVIINNLKRHYLSELQLFIPGAIICIDKIGKAEVIEAFCDDRGDIFYKCKNGIRHLYSISEKDIL